MHSRRIHSWSRCAGACIALLLAADKTHAHGAPLDRRVNWGDWNGDPVILCALTIISWLYARGLLRIWRRAGTGAAIGRWHAAAFATGVVTLAAALVSPLDPLSDQLSWAHMVQHMVLMTIAAPLVVLGAPLLAMLWGLPLDVRRTLARWWTRYRVFPWVSQVLWAPLLVFALYWFITWVWHLPALYNAAVRDPFVHDVQHISFFMGACLFWRVLLDPLSRRRLVAPSAVLFLFGATMHATVLGVLMALSPTAWYAAYDGRTVLWSLTPLEDQQLAGLIMWMPSCAAYLVAAVALIGHVLADRPADVRAARGLRPSIAPTLLELRSTG